MNSSQTLALISVLCALPASALAQTDPDDPNALVSSDAMNELMDLLVPTIRPRAPEGILSYRGLGGLAGQRQMEGRFALGEPTCGWSGGGANPGCQEIALMGSLLDANICDDAEAAGEAESLLMAKDAFVLLASNEAHQQRSVGVCPAAPGADTPNDAGTFTDDGTGHLRDQGTLSASAYTLGQGFSAGERYKDALRLLLTGCRQGDGACASAVARTSRCDSAARRELLSDFSALLEGASCSSPACSGVKHIYRRDDAGGVALSFLDLIGVDANGLAGRTSVLNGGGFPANIGAIPESFPYCDGGSQEQYLPSTNGADPVRVPCDPSADLCGADGQSGVVQAIASSESADYPTQQCGRNLFARVPWATTERAVCPDGTPPLGGLCRLPYREVNGQRDFNCINARNSRPVTLPNIDGRVYNYVRRTSSGRVLFTTVGTPHVASYRQNMVNIDEGFGAIAGKTYTAADVVCQESDATRNIACLVANSTCDLGLTTRPAAVRPAYSAQQEPLVIGGALPGAAQILDGSYPLSTNLYLGAIGGFEDLNADCEARGHTQIPGAYDYCYAQFEVAVAAWAMGGELAGYLGSFGYVPVPADYPGRCVGAQASAGCGAPVSQSLDACRPTRPIDR